jgi:glycyl-tRNA synthetase beta chain
MNLLIELLVEELPPKALKKLGEAFSSTLFESLKTQGLTAESSAVTSFATPRRLAAHITQVSAKAADKQVAQKLMPASVGLDASGNATPALIKRLQALGADENAVKNLRKENDGKADTLFLDINQTGATLQEGLQKALDETLSKLPIPKVMTYQLADGWESVNFVRPAHALVALHGETIVPVTALGLASGNATSGHRFEAAKPIITIKNADSYAEQLKTEGAVIANYEDRSKNIIYQLVTKARELDCWLEVEPKHTEGHPIQAPLGYAETEILLLDDQLIQEVTALVEMPNVLVGQFEAIYLEVPQECLILTMKANQKYFPLLDANGKLTNKFLIVSNVSPSDPSAVIGGNERVVRPRLADAKFFFDQDRKKTLESRAASLYKVTYHNKLESQGDRTRRVQSIATILAKYLGGDALATQAERAALLSKCDLQTDMVGEFPELQGIMGAYYARHDGEQKVIADAIEDHYKPRFAGDSLPRSELGLMVALADKLETLAGMFSIGQAPTGDKDPFALRRHALGVIRILIECKFPIELNYILHSIAGAALSKFQLPGDRGPMDALETFIFERFEGTLKETGYTPQEVDSVLVLRPQLLWEVPKRLEAVRAFSALPEAPALAAANKRVSNILKKVEGEVKAEVNTNLLQEPAEIALNAALSKVKPAADKLFESGDYTASLQALAALKAPVDDFFDNVMVNADDVNLKNNRLGLLAILHQTMNRVADLSKLAS